MRVKTENIPQELKKSGLFCLWRYEVRKGKRTKVPYNPNDYTQRGDSTQKSSFAQFDSVLFAAEEAQILSGMSFDGIGVGIFDRLGGVDIDHCIRADGSLTEMAAEIVEILDSYTEISPSGEGLRIFFSVPQGFSYDREKYYIKKSDIGLECYLPGMTSRFLTVTGNALRERSDLPDRSQELLKIIQKYMKRKETPQEQQRQTQSLSLSDQELISRACRSSQEFAALFSGQWQLVGYPSQSEADLALCNHLAFWTGRDYERMDSLFRQSGLYRAKWERADYRSGTIRAAIRDCMEVYTGQAQTPTAGEVFDFDSVIGKDSDHVESESTEQQTAPEDAPQIPLSLSQIAQNSLNQSQETNDQSVSEYVKSGKYRKDLEFFSAYKDRKTGFSNIDLYLTLYPGLAVLGGCSSLGKSTFAVNLAENLVRAGERVLFFALEQDPVELTSKIVSRRVFELSGRDPEGQIMNTSIKNGATGDLISQAESEVIRDFENLRIIRGDFQFTVDHICQIIEKYISTEQKKPVVFVDYLQLIAPAQSVKNRDPRSQVDYNVKKLKSFQRDHGLLLIMISNFNRASYDDPVRYESFKESGMIEFTCDYVWGLQLKIVGSLEFQQKQGKGGQITTADTNKAQKSQMTLKAAQEFPKKVQFVSLKSRNGVQQYIANFDYYNRFDAFVEEPEFPSAEEYWSKVSEEEDESEDDPGDLSIWKAQY